MTRNKIIYCYLDDIFHGCRYLGNLYVQNERGREIYSFEWSNECLEQEVPFPILDPRLFAGMYGRQYAGDRLFGVFSDACPDCWGHLLMSRGEGIRARQAGRRPAKLLESDFLLGVHEKAVWGHCDSDWTQKAPFLLMTLPSRPRPGPNFASCRTPPSTSRKTIMARQSGSLCCSRPAPHSAVPIPRRQ